MAFLDLKNDDQLRAEATEGVQLGYDGKQAIHPNQIQPIYECWSPGITPLLVIDEKTLEFATKIIQQNEEHQSQGFGAWSIDGKMIDMPMVKWAYKIVQRAR